MQDGLFERRISGVTVRFPITIGQVELDAAADRFGTIDGNGSIAKIRAGFAVPSAELKDVDLIAGWRNKLFSEIASEPTRLKFQLAWQPQWWKQRAFVDTRSVAHLG